MSSATSLNTNSMNDDLIIAIRSASGWYAILNADNVSTEQHQQWQEWLVASEQHQLAWQQVEAISGKINTVPGEIASPALQHADISRRELLRKLGALAILAPATVMLYKTQPWQALQSDYQTAVGVQRNITLADGSRMVLDTDTRVDVAFNGEQRLLHLHQGQILITTQPDTAPIPRPFIVETVHGSVQALGTRFSVQVNDVQTTVAVLEKAVLVMPKLSSARKLVAGQKIHFSTQQLGEQQQIEVGSDSWSQGSLVVVDMPLAELLAELARYRPGVLQCDEQVAQLKVSGAFPLNDIDKALTALTDTFPIRQRRLTRYWVTIVSKS